MLDLRFSKMFRFGKEGKVEILADILNALNDTTEVSRGTSNFLSSNFEEPTAFVDTRRAMIGVKFSFWEGSSTRLPRSCLTGRFCKRRRWRSLPFGRGTAIVNSMATLKVELPQQLHSRLRELVAQGWFSSETDVVQEAVRRFLEARAPEIMARFVMEDVEWGLRGSD